MKKWSIKRFLPLIIIIAILLATIYATMVSNNNGINHKQANLDVDSEMLTEQISDNNLEASGKNMLGVWVTYISLRDIDTSNSEESFKAKFDSIVETSKQNNINTLIVHVRPFSDALYPSNVFPWSHLLTGKQGVDPGFEPLKYMVEKTHENNMEFHAWLNLLRIQLPDTPKELADNNLYNIWRNDDDPNNDDFVVDYNGEKFLNPAYTQVQDKIIEGVKEIVKNYNVDAIHFDDYFYPKDASEEFDNKAYQNYITNSSDQSKLSLNEWRKSNINTLLLKIYSATKELKQNVQVGISPQANIQNDEKMGADVKTWSSVKGYADYICPQLYVNFENETLPFDKVADMWKNIVTIPEIKLYFGIGLYKAGSTDNDNGTWSKSNDIIKREVEYSKGLGINDFILYSYDYLSTEQTNDELKNAMKVLN